MTDAFDAFDGLTNAAALLTGLLTLLAAASLSAALAGIVLALVWPARHRGGRR